MFCVTMCGVGGVSGRGQDSNAGICCVFIIIYSIEHGGNAVDLLCVCYSKQERTSWQCWICERLH